MKGVSSGVGCKTEPRHTQTLKLLRLVKWAIQFASCSLQGSSDTGEPCTCHIFQLKKPLGLGPWIVTLILLGLSFLKCKTGVP